MAARQSSVGRQTEIILYLDYDGVLHPEDVYIKNGRPTLKGHLSHLGLFCWASILEEILKDYPEVRIRLSTSWVQKKSFSWTKQRLPPSLQEKVTGSTYHSRFGSFFADLNRFEEIYGDVRRQGYKRWVAIDDDIDAWPDQFLPHLVPTLGNLGLSAPAVQKCLRQKLSAFTAKGWPHS